MNTPTHAILNLAFLGHKEQPSWNPLIIWGALIPDLAMFGFYALLKFQGISEPQIWGTEYYRPFWQDVFDLFNSIPLAVIGIAVMLHFKRTGWALLFGSIVLHCLEDLPLHVDDGHRHFWPLSNFRFESPISYWDPDHHGAAVAGVEYALVLFASWRVWKLLRSHWMRALLIVSNGLMGLVYVRFYG